MPFDRRKYPKDWDRISRYIRFTRASGRCEGSPAYPHCRAQHGKPHPVTGSIVVLTVAHLDHDPTNNDLDNLAALCQRCHLTHDAAQHAANARTTRHRRQRHAQLQAGQLALQLPPQQ
jgi:hypothetical protein